MDIQTILFGFLSGVYFTGILLTGLTWYDTWKLRQEIRKPTIIKEIHWYSEPEPFYGMDHRQQQQEEKEKAEGESL